MPNRNTTERCCVFETLREKEIRGQIDALLFSHQVVYDSPQPHGLCSTPGFPVPHHLLELPKFMAIDQCAPSQRSSLLSTFKWCSDKRWSNQGIMMDRPRLLSSCEDPQWGSGALHFSAASSKNDFMRQVERYSEELGGRGAFPGETVVRCPPANAGDMASIPGQGRSHILQGNSAHAPQRLKSVLCNKRRHCNEKPMCRNRRVAPTQHN